MKANLSDIKDYAKLPTETINSGNAIAKLGKKVLLIDLDPKSNLTMALGSPNPMNWN